VTRLNDAVVTPSLYLAFELGNTEWKLGMSSAIDRPVLVRSVSARGLAALEREITRAKIHLGLPATALVKSGYEAGRDGFWLHRWLVSRGIVNWIVDSSSIEVNRRRRRTKTDRVDAIKLVSMLIRAHRGEKNVWSVVNVPTPAEEDRRHVHRELLFARRDRGRHISRIKRLLASQGIPLTHIQELPQHLVTARLWDGSPLSPRLRARLEREWETVQVYRARVRAMKKERRVLLRVTDDRAIAQVRQLHRLLGVGIDGAWL
jgi:transposase